MNYIQKAWLYVLKPITPFINEKLAKRSGLLGKLGRWFTIGPREFGFHPTSKLNILVNRGFTYYLGFLMQKYSLIKSFTNNGYHFMRPYRFIALLPFILAGSPFIFMASYNNFFTLEEGTNLKWLQTKQRGRALPINALNHRLSAHYTEINSIYSVEMMKKYSAVYDEIISERDRATEQERKTLFARKGYKYIPHGSNPDGK